MRGFFDALFSLYGLIIFALGVVLAGWVMSVLGSARGKVAKP